MPSKRQLLHGLTRSELQEVAVQLHLHVADRRSKEALVDAAAASRSVILSDLLPSYSRERLKELCRTVGLDDGGKEKAILVERLIGAKVPEAGTYAINPGPAPKAAELFADYEPLPGDEKILAKGSRTKKKGSSPRRRTGGYESVSVVSGSLKAALRQLALGAAGGYRGREALLSFTTHLLECFGWPDGRPPGAEIPRLFSIAEAGLRTEREVALWWPARGALMEVAAHDAVLDFAWKDLARVCFQLDPIPQYIVLTNQRDLQLYDLARDRHAPRLSIPIDDLPKYSEAFPFFTTDWKPGAVPKIVNVEKVSGEVADLVARLYRSVRARHPKREHDVIRFTLQCITAMFAEDIGLIPKNYFTSLLYDAAKSGKVEHRLRELFEQMNTPELPAPRVVPYFNGGLFTDVATLPLGSEQVLALTKAAEANWTYVDPHIFGSVFQGIMDHAERHAQGAHYTAQDDIMRVVGPTIVEPWRKRVQAAGSLKELTELRNELLAYRVLDPACGSGNFLYIAFRELYRLDTELLSRMREFPSTAAKLSWNGGISAKNFFGIDINPFAVELAKVTLNIAKKIAYEERKAQAFALAGQVEMDLDPSLPLDNLDSNIVCGDALFTDWPNVEAIVGNPPILGDRKIRRELGAEYLAKLQAASGVDGVVDLSCYWFRKAHELLCTGGRAGLVGTSGVRVGKAREAALDYIVANGGTITNAVSSREWPGEAALNVSMVNWTKGKAEGPFHLVVDDHVYPLSTIPTHLQPTTDVGAVKVLRINRAGTSMGMIFGNEAFVLPSSDTSLLPTIRRKKFIRPIATGTAVLTGVLTTGPDYGILLTACTSATEAQSVGGAAFDRLRKTVLPAITKTANSDGKTQHYARWLRTWWQPLDPRRSLLADLGKMRRYIVCSSPQARPIFAFISSAFVPTNTLQVFAYDDDYTFGVIQSSLHWAWVKSKGGRVRADFRYTSSVWETFPWPQDPTDTEVHNVAAAGRELRRVRAELMGENAWSLRGLYQAAEVEGAHPLKNAQAALDLAVRDAYGVPTDQDAAAFLLELNQLVAEDEEHGGRVRGPGLPDHLDPKDPRWMSSDCIEPPSVS
jgi:SAM-dependent methyltransferase